MAGRTVRITPPRSTNATGLTNGNSIVITLAERIDASQFELFDLVVRFHTKDIGSGSSFAITVVPDGFTPDDPNTDFFGAALATVTLNDQSVAPSVTVEQGTTKLGSLLSVRLTCVKGAGNCSGRISIDLVLKTN